ncbi:hypothetical protein BKA66DRAFT_404730 [Pyrenochaeta sp. MPI-SDFR-AT-0127]|nr:hypothetical protein BKA66DRAFT_404730 [Pyrenochaeta sp. MPI-SDFR-AT-0127]
MADVPNTIRSRTHQAEVSQQPRAKSKSAPKQHLLPSSAGRKRTRQTHQREKKDCIICADTRSLHRFPNRPPTTQCQHDIDVCRRCLRTWIQSEFEVKIWDEINCPICPIRMQHEDMREFAPSAVFRRYDKLSTRAAFEAIPGFTWCITKGCKSGQEQPPGTAKFRCLACKKAHCVEHNVPWHKKETCKEYDYRTNKKLKKAEEVASKKLILETTKKCPGCKRNIERSYGCDHMTCSKCKHEFCWQCLAPYAQKFRGRVIHRVGCDHFNPDWIPD